MECHQFCTSLNVSGLVARVSSGRLFETSIGL